MHAYSGRHHENFGVPATHCRGCRGPCSPPVPDGPRYHAIRLGEGNQTRLQHLDQTPRSRKRRFRMAGGIRRLLGQRMDVGANPRIHRQPGAASPPADVPGRISSVAGQARHRMGRAFRVGLTQPRWGWGAEVELGPRVAAVPQPWEYVNNVTNPSGVASVGGTHGTRQAWHGMGRAFRLGLTQPRWGSGTGVELGPRVAAVPQPWECVDHVTNPSGVVSGGGTHGTWHAWHGMGRAFRVGLTQPRWGWGAGVELGSRVAAVPQPWECVNHVTNPSGVVSIGGTHGTRQAWHGMGRAFRVGLTQPRWGWRAGVERGPRVAAVPQPWAGGQNPVGIRIRPTAEQLADVVREEMEGGT